MKPLKRKGRIANLRDSLVSLWKTNIAPRPAPRLGYYSQDEFLYIEGERKMKIMASHDGWFVEESIVHDYNSTLKTTILVDSIRRWCAPHDRERVSEAEQQRILQSFCRLLETRGMSWALSMKEDYHDPDEDRFYRHDWEAEAQKIRLAFGIKKPCEFALDEHDFHPSRTLEATLPESKSQKFLVRYYMGSHSFNLYDKRSKTPTIAEIHFDWDGQMIGEAEIRGCADVLAKGLYHLGLLTPEVETALKVSVSAHQKMEWALDYEARNGI